MMLMFGRGPLGLLWNPESKVLPTLARPGLTYFRGGALQIVSTAMLVLQISFSFSIDRNIWHRDATEDLNFARLMHEIAPTSLDRWSNLVTKLFKWSSPYRLHIELTRVQALSGKLTVKTQTRGEQGVSEAERGEACPEIERIIFCLRRLWWAEKTNWLIWPLPAQREIFKINILKTIRLTDKMKTMFKYVFSLLRTPQWEVSLYYRKAKEMGNKFRLFISQPCFLLVMKFSPSGDWTLNLNPKRRLI